MQRHSDLLKLLDPSLDEDIAHRAGGLLDAVTASLEKAGTTPLSETIPPPLSFDPEHYTTVRPRLIDLAAMAPDLPPPGGEPAAGDWARLAPDVLAGALADGRLRVEAVYAELAERVAAWQPVINAFLEVNDLGGDVTAAKGVLGGVPIGVQDMIDTAGMATTAGSMFLRGRVPAEDGAPWAALRAAGAVLAGKLNTQEFAAGTTGDNDWYGPMRNPWDPTRTAGGAAGGAGAAVAAGLIPAAIGTDPGGSIRVPAAFCGVTCFKPTYGAIDRRGTIPLTWTTETIGVLASTVAGGAVLADLLLDGRSRERWGIGCAEAARRGRLARRLPLRVGVPANWLAMGLEPGIKARFEEALAALSALGATLVEITLPEHDEIAPVHRAIAFSEASTIHESLIRAHATEYGSLIRDRQEAGRGMLAIDYLNAWRLRGGFLRAASENWRQVDVIVTPTAPVAAPRVGARTVSTGSRGPEAAHTVYTRYSAPMSTLGWPVVSVPAGLTDDGLPAGLQLAGPPHSDPLIFLAAAALEEAIGWHDRPSLAAARDRASKEALTDV